ncbi:MAG: ABC transporter permease [Planctomycetota bacterium]|jgi:phospholipid/cholesterol/gamma-HCH transport system permease protein
MTARGSIVGESFRLERHEPPDGPTRIAVSGELRYARLVPRWSDVRELAAGSEVVDLSGVENLDGGSAALLVELAAPDKRLESATGDVERLLDLYGPAPLCAPEMEAPKRQPVFDQAGRFTARILGELAQVADYVGQLLVEVRLVLRHPSRFSIKQTVSVFARTGPDALPVITLIHLLIGLVLALQSARQLETFGAEIFVANLVGLSVVRELGPLMTAIVLAGRSGAAFAAELGTMRVSEEIDALRTMGIAPLGYLVLPRLVALMIAAPLLTFVADAVAILGGLSVGWWMLDLPPSAYWANTRAAIGAADVWVGLIKSLCFAAACGLISCERGLATHGGALGVGRSTTSAVVTILFHLVVIDAILTWVFNVYNL